jgi:manganese/zinc/iron transport system permease protein
MDSIFLYFTDPVLRGPTIGCMLMSLSAALVGVLVFLRRESLIGESLSHSAYPGIMLGCFALAGLSSLQDETVTVWIMAGAFVTSILGLWSIHWLERSFNIRSDSALCFILALFFGIGLTMASHLQSIEPSLYRKAQAYLYGQAATMTDFHIFLYGALALMTITLLALFKNPLRLLLFDRSYARTIGMNVWAFDQLVFSLVILAVIIGMRSVGVVLMSAMLIAPAAAARQYTHKMGSMLVLAGIFGALSGFLGNYLSVEFSYSLLKEGTSSFPTGPSVVVVAAFICIISLLIAPERGLLRRAWRIAGYRYQCACENLLKFMWKHGGLVSDGWHALGGVSPLLRAFILFRLKRNGWIVKAPRGEWELTLEGKARAAKIVRLHRLWEVYLVEYLGVGSERVHRNAEEMEHVLTPELERQLTLLLNDPSKDPHAQPIPPMGYSGDILL